VIRTAFRALPGPFLVRFLIALVVVTMALVALHFFYDWLGRLLLDPGGAIG
jgi:hypothetical protein